VGVRVREKIEGTGIYWVFINHNGQRSSKCVGREKTAQKVAEMIQARLKLGQDVLPKEKVPLVPTLAEYYKKFKRVYMETALRYSTLDSYDRNFRIHILPALGTSRLDEINRADVEELIAELTKKDLAKDSIRLVLAALGVLFSHAKENKLIQDNPATRMGRHYRQSAKVHEEIQPLTADEVLKFLGIVSQASPEHFALFLCAIHTGLRSGEIAGLRWDDLDFNGKFIVVRRSVKMGRISPTKTNKIRRVDISDDLMVAFHDLKKKRMEHWLTKATKYLNGFSVIRKDILQTCRTSKTGTSGSAYQRQDYGRSVFMTCATRSLHC
jgi:integrase